MAMTRRLLLTSLGAMTVCPICAAAQTAPGQGQGHGHAPGESHGLPSHWSYDGDTGPSHWGEMSAEWKTCLGGAEQSPINISEEIPAELRRLKVDYTPFPLRILNNGHTVQVNAPETAGGVSIGDVKHKLLQFHFHHPSEHQIHGKSHPMELHLVHRSESGKLAVLGVFIVEGRENKELAHLWAHLPRQEGPEQAIDAVTVHPEKLLPDMRHYYRYIGSLTTPTCTEGIVWTVFEKTIQASAAQIALFSELFPNNARPPQDRKDRFLLRG